MRLRREVKLGIGAILVLQLLLSALTIALLNRMGPAIERILRENVYSEEAVEDMLSVLAVGAGTPSVEHLRTFDDGLARARANITEPAERPLLDAIEAFRRDGMPAAGRAAAIDALRRLGRVNRESMARADERAQRIGLAGAWAAVMLGGLALGLGVVVYRRMRLRLELPLIELQRTTSRARAGNLQARCAVADAPAEVMQVAADVNWLLDAWPRARQAATGASANSEREAEIRRLLAWLLDARPEPVVVFDLDGKRVATNAAGLGLEPDTPVDEEVVPGTSLRVVRGRAGPHATPEPGDEP